MDGGRGDDGDRPTVLVVEDDESVLELIRLSVAQTGARVLAASSPAEAAVVAKGAQVDVLLTDVVLPGSSGIAFAESLRAEQPHLRVIYVTGWHEHGTLADVPEAVLVRKPFTLSELARTVARAMDEDPSAGGAPAA